jgi:hypothetical protein
VCRNRIAAWSGPDAAGNSASRIAGRTQRDTDWHWNDLVASFCSVSGSFIMAGSCRERSIAFRKTFF